MELAAGDYIPSDEWQTFCIVHSFAYLMFEMNGFSTEGFAFQAVP